MYFVCISYVFFYNRIYAMFNCHRISTRRGICHFSAEGPDRAFMLADLLRCLAFTKSAVKYGQQMPPVVYSVYAIQWPNTTSGRNALSTSCWLYQVSWRMTLQPHDEPLFNQQGRAKGWATSTLSQIYTIKQWIETQNILWVQEITAKGTTDESSCRRLKSVPLPILLP